MKGHEFHTHLTLINVATPPCESPNTENVIVQPDITEENCTRCVIASPKWTRVIMCLKRTYFGRCTAMRVRNRERESLFATKYKKNIQNHSKYNNSGRLPDR